MARRVFFSFHYERDVRRIQQVRNSWVVRERGVSQPFYDGADFEDAKRRAGGIQNWIDEQLNGCSVTAVLFGAETYNREWVKYEIKKSYEMKDGHPRDRHSQCSGPAARNRPARSKPTRSLEHQRKIVLVDLSNV